MAITSYSELQTAVANWLHRGDLTSIIPDLIMLAEERIFRTVRAREMETAFSETIASGVIAVPAAYVSFKSVYLDGTPTTKLKRATVAQIYENYPNRSSDSKPKYIAREGSNFIFVPYPDSGYTVKGIYYARLTSIATSANALFTANPDLYLMATLCESAPYIKDDTRVKLWEEKFAQIKADIERESDEEERSGSGMQVRTA